MPEYRKFVEFIDEQLALRKWKPIDLARAMKVQQGQVTKILKPKSEEYEPDLSTLRKLAKAFGISVDKLTPYFVHDENWDVTDLNGENSWNLGFSVEEVFGRSREMDTLTEYCDRNKLIFIAGLAGIGKSSLAKSLQHLVSDKFDAVIFLRLNFNLAIADIAEAMRERSNVQLSSNAIADIIKALNEKRYLLILDGLDIDDPDHSQDYHHLLEQIAETEHKSCAIVTCCSLPKKYRSWYPLPKVVTLKGLDEIDVIQLLENKGLEIESQKIHVQELIKRHDGNPDSLIYAIQDVFDLNQGDVKAYLNCNTFGAKHIKEQITGIFGRLSRLELELLYWLALQNKAFKISEIITIFPDHYKISMHRDDVQDALDELIRRSLLQHEIEFTLSQAVQLCAEDYLSRTLSREIKKLNVDSLGYLRSIELRHEKVKLRDRISRSCSEETLCQALNKLEDPSNRLSANAIGYAIANLRYLLGKDVE
jgi:transcriptional regulator with XRE-family HTH domain